MSDQSKQKFSWRAFTTLYITVSFVIMIISGVILYIAPPGRIAKWTHLPILGLEKEQWQALHTIFTFLFIFASGFHLYFNWKPFIFYLRNKICGGLRLRKELIFAFLLTIIVSFFTLQRVPPFSMVMTFGESVKESWSSDQYEPPVAHAEELTLKELAYLLQKEPDQLIHHLQNQGISSTEESLIKNLAQKNDLSPQDLFLKMQIGTNLPGTSAGNGKGYGRKTVGQICEEENILLLTGLNNLKSAGIDADVENNIRQLADKYKKSPLDIVNVIIGKTVTN